MFRTEKKTAWHKDHLICHAVQSFLTQNECDGTYLGNRYVVVRITLLILPCFRFGFFGLVVCLAKMGVVRFFVCSEVD